MKDGTQYSGAQERTGMDGRTLSGESTRAIKYTKEWDSTERCENIREYVGRRKEGKECKRKRGETKHT